ncbi:MAG: hypothetical protein HYX52_07375 [Chloroflexi bacterium]|nr:hypothetical protein [Chloroflexota bacterium]
MALLADRQNRQRSAPTAPPRGDAPRPNGLDGAAVLRAAAAHRPSAGVRAAAAARTGGVPLRWIVGGVTLVLGLALTYLVQTGGVATTGYDIQRLQAARADWQLKNDQLRLELAKRRSLAWVEAEATSRLGMQRPASVTYLGAPAAGAR